VRSRLLWKFLLVIIFVIACDMVIVWLAIDFFAAEYFSFLMERYNLPKDEVQHMFLDAAHRYILLAGVVALALAIVISFILIRQILKPIYDMAAITGKIAQGDYSEKVEVTSADEIGELAQSFNRMSHSLDAFERLRKDMVANVAHELRAPLTNMRGYLEALSDGVLPPSPKTFELLHDETLRLVTLTDQLLLLSKADTAHENLDLKLTNLPENISQVLDLFKASFASREITVDVAFPEKPIQVNADQTKLGQVLRNLMQNALQYTRRGGRVAIKVEPSPGWVKVIFSNTGDGIGEKDLPYIFERFYRAEKSRSRDYGGAGIGLAIVKELIAAHGGECGAESSSKETHIWFTLPYSR
jgi:two-component system, OmpR family, sensor histidine kinase BaeS